MRPIAILAATAALAAGLIATPEPTQARTHHGRHVHRTAYRAPARPATRSSSACLHRKNTGTVVGAVGGGLIGNAVGGHGVGGTLLGAGAGAVAGHEIARRGC